MLSYQELSLRAMVPYFCVLHILDPRPRDDKTACLDECMSEQDTS